MDVCLCGPRFGLVVARVLEEGVGWEERRNSEYRTGETSWGVYSRFANGRS